METSASFEARSAPSSYPTSSEALLTVRLLRGSSRSQLSGADKGIALRITDSHN